MSVELGETFGSQVDRLATVAATVAGAEFDRIAPEDLQSSFVIFLARTADALEALHGSALELAGAYVSAAAREAGVTLSAPAPPGLRDEDPFGRPVGELLGPVAGKVYLGLEQGRTPAEALEIGRNAVVSIAQSFVRDAARSELSHAFERADEIVAFRWWSRGTCGACMGADNGEDYPPGASLNVHPNCQCIAEPVFEPPKTELEGAAARTAWDEARPPWRIGLDPELVTALQEAPALRAQAQTILRSGEALSPELETFVGKLDELTAGESAFRLEKSTATFRVIDGEALEKLAGLRDGTVFRDAGFTHVTVDPRLALQILREGLGAGGGATTFVAKTGERALLRIHLPQGQTAAIGYGEMEEFVLPRGMTFRVRGRSTIETLDGPVEVIEIDVVQVH